jgi:EmrB/QacA subfamily drug resistance transporter
LVASLNPRPSNLRQYNAWVVLVLVCMAQFMVVLDATIVNTALPSIQRALDFSDANLQWIVNAYTLVFGGFLLLGGRAGDLLGRKRLFLAGVVVFTGASLISGLAASSGMLIAARALQGLGGALISPVALSIITTTFAEGRAREKALGIWGAIAAGGAAFGLLFGGMLTEWLSWRWIFFVNLPIGAATFLLTTRLVPESKGEEEGRSFDVAGATAVTAGLVSLVYAIVKAPAAGWGSATTLGFGGLALVLLAAFVVIELRSAAPLVRLSIFRVRTVTVANSVLFLVVTGMFAMFFFVTLFMQGVLGFSPIQSGLAYLPFTAGIMISAGFASRFATQIGLRTAIGAAMLISTAGMLLLLRITPGSSYLPNLLPSFMLISLGLGLAFVSLTLLATGGLENRDQGLASGLFNTSQQVGGALGLALLSTVAASRTSHILNGLGHPVAAADRASALVDGFHLAFLLGGIFMIVGGIIVTALLRRQHVERVVEQAEPEAVAA